MSKNSEKQLTPLFIRRNQLKQITGLSQSSIWRLEQEGKFPARRKIGSCVGWLYSEVEDFLNKAKSV